MKKEEKNKKIYQKIGININEDTTKEILQDKERTKSLMRLYKQEEMDSMNYILGKDKDNKVFTKEELELMNTINLFNRKLVEACKVIYQNESRCSECI